MNAIAERARTPRMDIERSKRRRRDDIGVGRMRNLDVIGEKDPNFEYRWVNDEPGRMYQLTKADDWEVVNLGDLGEAHAKDKGVGTGIERVIDKRTGKRAVLLRKPKDYYVADKAKEQGLIDDTEKSIKRGQISTAGGVPGEALAGPSAYVPAGGISMQVGSRST